MNKIMQSDSLCLITVVIGQWPAADLCSLCGEHNSFIHLLCCCFTCLIFLNVDHSSASQEGSK